MLPADASHSGSSLLLLSCPSCKRSPYCQQSHQGNQVTCASCGPAQQAAAAAAAAGGSSREALHCCSFIQVIPGPLSIAAKLVRPSRIRTSPTSPSRVQLLQRRDSQSGIVAAPQITMQHALAPCASLQAAGAAARPQQRSAARPAALQQRQAARQRRCLRWVRQCAPARAAATTSCPDPPTARCPAPLAPARVAAADSDLTQEELEEQLEAFMRRQAEIESGAAARKVEPGKVLGADEVSDEVRPRSFRAHLEHSRVGGGCTPMGSRLRRPPRLCACSAPPRVARSRTWQFVRLQQQAWQLGYAHLQSIAAVGRPLPRHRTR